MPLAVPFALDDVLLMHVLCALPIAVIIALLVRRQMSVHSCRLIGGLLLVAVVTLAVLSKEGWVGWQGFAARSALAVGLLTGSALVGVEFVQRWMPESFSQALDLRITLLVVMVLPAAAWTYESARCRRDLARLADYLEQSRLGDAQAVAQRLRKLQPQAELRGKSVAQLATEIDRLVAELQARVRRPLGAAASSPAKMERARELAMLGQTAAAIDVLSSLPDLVNLPVACNLCGTIGETEQAWPDAASWYRRARDTSLADRAAGGPGPELERALTGLAYCQRKQGDYAAAEQSYLQLLSVAPSADTYFLLAHFYEDVQQAGKAQTCAKRAMALAPERYQAEGQRLIDKLVTLHFGCLQAYADR